jgi:hypothetical protein
VHVSEIREVQAGKLSAVLRRGVAHSAAERCCLSIVYARRSLDLEAPTREV